MAMNKNKVEDVLKRPPMICEALKEHFKKMFDFELSRFVINNKDNILDSFDGNVSLFVELDRTTTHDEVLEWASNYMDDYIKKKAGLTK